VLEGVTTLEEVGRVVDLTEGWPDAAISLPRDGCRRPIQPGNMDAANEPDLELRLHRMGLDLIDCRVSRARWSRSSA
jgi:hypothetical protein